MSADEVITITCEEYEALQDDAEWLRALRAAGVDNWQGYEQAQDILEDME